MLNWRDLGLQRGEQGDTFSAAPLICPYCGGHGKFNRVFRGKARDKEEDTDLYSDVWQCLECANFVFVIWHSSQGFYNYRAFPYEKTTTLSHPSWPEQAAHAYEEAVGALLSADLDSAMVMAKHTIGAAIDSVTTHSPGPLLEELTHLAKKGRISRTLAEWAQSLPALSTTQRLHTIDETRDVVRLSRYLLEQLYTLPFDAQRHLGENHKP
jgi:hypothetical protein